MGSQSLSYVNSERVLFQIWFFLMLPEEKGIGERTLPQIILGLLTMEKCKYRIRLLSCKTLLFSRLVSMPARRMVKGRADERAEGAFRDSRGLLNWCCPFKCSKSLLYQPGLCTYSHRAQALRISVWKHSNICASPLFGDVGRMLAEPHALRSVPCSRGTS